MPLSEIAAELGIHQNQLHTLKEQLEAKGDKAFSNKLGRPLKKTKVKYRHSGKRIIGFEKKLSRACLNISKSFITGSDDILIWVM